MEDEQKENEDMNEDRDIEREDDNSNKETFTHPIFFSGTSLTAILTCVLRSRAAYTTPYVPLPSTILLPPSSNSYSYCKKERWGVYVIV